MTYIIVALSIGRIKYSISFSTVLQVYNKTLGRALDPRANGAWLSKLTE